MGEEKMEENSETNEDSWSQRNKYGLMVVWGALFCDYLLMTLVIPIFPSALPTYSEFEIGLLFSSKVNYIRRVEGNTSCRS